MKNEEDALEVLNTAFLKVFRNIRQYKQDGPFEAWAKRIVINASIDRLKKEKRNLADAVPDVVLHDHGAVDNQAISNLEMEEIYSIIRELPRMSQAVFNMHIVDGYPHKEISAMLGISEGTSKWHVSFAKQELRKMIEKKMLKISWQHA